MIKDQLKARRALAGDMPVIYLFGHDEWGEGRPEVEHLAVCQGSKKYLKGTWYLLEKNSEPVSALICYRSAFALPEGIVGIGSVATAPSERRRGYASHLIREVMARLSAEAPVDGYFLYSDVDPLTYEKLGFVRLPPDHQRYEKSVAMICPGLKSVHALVGPGFRAPDYF